MHSTAELWRVLSRLAEAGENGSALVFASDAQLELLRCAAQIYFDTTFKIVPIFSRLLTIK